MLTVDFETQAIEPRPVYPPEPVGCALLSARSKAKYLSWGHPGDNTPLCRAAVRERLTQERSWLCHNGGFDVAVAAERLGVPIPERVDDTLFLGYLLDPYTSHSLEALAEKYLGLKPEAWSNLRQWMIENKVTTAKDKKWARFVAKAPSLIAGPYALEDIQVTRELFEHLAPMVKDAGMWDAYEREVAILPMLVGNEQRGVPLNRKRLERDLPGYERMLGVAKDQIHRLLGFTFEIDSNEELADVLEHNGFTLPLTEKGNRRTAKGALDEAIPDGPLKGWLLYHSAIGYALSNFLRPWAAMMEGSNESVIHIKWNQVKGSSSKNVAGGTKTGRLSSEPNLQNLTTGETRDTLIERLHQLLGKRVATKLLVPEIRSYVEAPKGYTLYGRDFSQQELKILADAEEGILQQAYIDNVEPHDEEGFTDIHALVKGRMKDVTGRDYPRKIVKNVNFGKIYGLGGPGLSETQKIPIEQAYEIIKAHGLALPSVQDLSDEFRKRGDKGEPIYTLGGRRYYAEAPKDGRSVAYRLLNYYIQGGAADQTKEAMRLWWEEDLKNSSDNFFLAQVHDELLGMAPTSKVKAASKRLNDYMVGAFKLSVPQRTTSEFGKNWGAMK